MASQQILSVSDATSLEWPSTAVDGVWIFGPTASGKSSLALSIATSRPAVIINADASQIYAPLQVLSARPSAAECAQAPHALYGVLGAMEHASVTRWLALLAPAIAAARAEGKLPVVVGGTGMYLGAALQGISPIPDIPTDVRDRLRARLAAEGLPAMHAALLQQDPVLGAKLKPGDTQRILRALEVVEHTGTPLSVWQAAPRVPALPPMQWHGVVVLPERSVLRTRIAQRAEAMWHGGALPEVQALMDAGVPDDAPVCRAIGVAEIRAYLRGECTQAQALDWLTIATQQYAKRQVTWARHQL